MAQLVKQYSNGALPGDELEAAAERGFVKALETYVYRPGSKFVQTLSIHVRRCIESEIVSQVRKATTKTSMASRQSVEDLTHDPVCSSSIEDADTKLQLAMLSEVLTEAEFFALTWMMQDSKDLTPEQRAAIKEHGPAIQEAAKRFL